MIIQYLKKQYEVFYSDEYLTFYLPDCLYNCPFCFRKEKVLPAKYQENLLKYKNENLAFTYGEPSIYFYIPAKRKPKLLKQFKELLFFTGDLEFAKLILPLENTKVELTYRFFPAKKLNQLIDFKDRIKVNIIYQEDVKYNIDELKAIKLPKRVIQSINTYPDPREVKKFAKEIKADYLIYGE